MIPPTTRSHTIDNTGTRDLAQDRSVKGNDVVGPSPPPVIGLKDGCRRGKVELIGNSTRR